MICIIMMPWCGRCGYFTHRYGKIERLDSLNEYWLNSRSPSAG